ncbi:MAG: helix-turn-helix domain-containing protein [Candidatus Thorarchaeota archaeon]
MSNEAVTEVVSVLKKNLGITNAESKAILPILIGGNMTVGGVSQMIGETVPTVKKTLGRLVKKGLIKEIEGIVPVYRAIPPNLSLLNELSAVNNEVSDLTSISEKAFSSSIDAIDNAIKKVIDSKDKSLEKVSESLATYEDSMSELVRSRIEQVKTSASTVMESLSEDLEEIMNKLDNTLDNRLGSKIMELQKEIDKSQLALERDVKRISSEFDKWLKVERKTTLTTITEFESKSASLIKAARDAVTNTLTASSEVLHKIAQKTTKTLSSMVSNASDEGVEVLNTVSGDLTQLLTRVESQLEQTYTAGQESLREVLVEARTIPADFSDFVKGQIGASAEIAESVISAVESWKDEVSSFMDVASQSVTSQLDQVASTDANYIDVMKNTLTSHIEKLNGMVKEEYDELQNLGTTLGNDCETTLADTRVLVLDLLEQQNLKEQKSCDAATKALHSELDGWVASTIQSIEKKLGDTSTDVSNILNTETTELHSIAETMNSRLQSAFNSIIKSTTAKNEALITSIKTTTHNYEASVGARLEELIGSFTTTAEKQARDSKSLYQQLRNRLDKRMTQSINEINSHANRIQSEIDSTIKQQDSRIEQHTMAIREEFHTHLDDITQQFITLTQGLEATFNGLLSSQTVEARDLIASAHTEFKTSLKNEMTSLKEDSQKLQQEYSAELGMKIDEVASSVAGVKKSLEEVAVQKRLEISESMAAALSKLEASIQSTEESLREMESGTIKQFTDTMNQVSLEFNQSVDAARDNIAERLDNVRADTSTSLEKSSAAAKSIADSFISEQKDHKQRVLADTSKKINRLATKRVKASSANIEEFHALLSERETGGVKDRNSAKDEVIRAVEARRAEVAQAFDAASVWVDSTVSNVATSLETFGTKLRNELTLLQNDLLKSADEASVSIAERGEEAINRFAEITTELISNSEAEVTERINAFGSDCAIALAKGTDAFTKMPSKIAEKIEELDTIISEETNQSYSVVVDKLASSFTEFHRSSESASEEFRNLLEQSSIQTTEKRNEAIEAIRQSANLTNQQAARKLEAIGLDLKTQLSTESSYLTEKARSELARKNLVLTDSVTEASNETAEAVSVLQQTRRDALTEFNDAIDKTLRRTSNDQKKKISSLNQTVLETVSNVTDITTKAVDILDAIHKAMDILLDVNADRTWYLSGFEESCAHISDMARRAKESVVISVPDLACLDLAQLSKARTAKRKVLIIPEPDEPGEELETLSGWRIWHSKTPMLLSVMDDKEILVGGALDSKSLISVVSEDEAYLKLYHDVLGPQLIKGRIA